MLKRLIRNISVSFKKFGTLNLVLILVGAFFVWFNWQMLEIFREYACIPETYACAVVAATIGECGICGWIRTNKDRKREHEWEKDQEKKISKNKNEDLEKEDEIYG